MQNLLMSSREEGKKTKIYEILKERYDPLLGDLWDRRGRIMEALVEEAAFELGFHGLLGLGHAEHRAGKDLPGRRSSRGRCPGCAQFGRKAGNEFHTFLGFHKEYLIMTVPYLPRPMKGSEAPASAPSCSPAWRPGCLGLLRPQTCLILEGRGVPLGLGGPRG